MERICPICGGTIECHNRCGDTSSSVYGVPVLSELCCDDPSCGFGLAFPFDVEVYRAYASEEIRRRTRELPADRRVEALLASLSHCAGNDEALRERVNVIFMEALGEILRDAREMLRALSFREPDEGRRRESREQLRIFLNFLSIMEERYPTARLEQEFTAIAERLSTIDRHYELGMLALSDDPSAAEAHFEQGAREGGIRSRVAYVKYVLAERAETEDERKALKEAIAALAAETQEACYEYACRAEIGIDDVLSVLRSYEDATYPTLSASGRLAFLRMELTVCVERYEPTLAALLAMPRLGDGAREGQDRIRRVLDELSELARRLTVRCEALLREIDDLTEDTDYVGDTSAERSAALEENAIIEYVIGCCMYYESVLDMEKRLDIRYLRTASGHFSCFLSSDLFAGIAGTEIEIPSLIGFRNLRAMAENAVRYRLALEESAGLSEGGR